MQGTAVEGFKMALTDLDGRLAGHDAQIFYILHDEIIVEAREDVADCVAAVAKDYASYCTSFV